MVKVPAATGARLNWIAMRDGNGGSSGTSTMAGEPAERAKGGIQGVGKLT